MSKIQKIYAATIGLDLTSHAKVFKKNKYSIVCVNDLNIRKKLAKSLKTIFTQIQFFFKNKKINLVSIASFDNYHFQHL